MSPLSRLIRGFSNRYHLSPHREDQCEWHRMTMMTGSDCAAICSLINTHTHKHTQQDRRITQRTRVQGREARDRIGGGGVGAEKRRRIARSHRRVTGAMWKMGKTWAEEEKKHRQGGKCWFSRYRPRRSREYKESR